MKLATLVVVLALFTATVASAQPTVIEFHPNESGMRSQGSKIDLVFDRFTERPVVANPEALTITIEYPVYGSNTPTVQRVIECGGIQWRFDPNLELDVITACLKEEIHDTDELLTMTISLPQGWATYINQQQTVHEQSEAIVNFAITNESEVDYPKPIASWDMVPHQIYSEPFHVDLLVFHRYTYEHSEYGDFEIEVWIDTNPAQAGAPPITGPAIGATARPAFKVPQRSDIPLGTYLVYRVTLDPAEFIDDVGLPVPVDGPEYVHFVIKPSRGDADSILVSSGYHDQHVWDPADLPDSMDPDVVRVQPNLENMKIFMNGGGTLETDPVYAVVSASADINAEGTWSTNAATARSDPFGTVYSAVQALDDLAEMPIVPVILMGAGQHWTGKAPGSTADNDDIAGEHWLTIRPDYLADPPVERDEVEITDVAFIVSSETPLNDVLLIDNNTGGEVRWAWQSGDEDNEDEGFRIIRTGVFDHTFARNNRTVADLAGDINDISGLNATVVTGLGEISIDQDQEYYEPDTEFIAIPNNSSDAPVPAHSIIETRFDGGNNVYVFSNLTEMTYIPINTPNVASLLTNMETDFPNLETEGVHDGTLLTQLRDGFGGDGLRYNVPANFKEGENVWFEADPSSAGLRYPFVRFFDCWIRSHQLVCNQPEAAPRHLWLDQALLKHESHSSVDSTEVTAAAGHWQGGMWYTRCDFDTVNKSAASPVMIRDAHFHKVGGDSGKQVSFALNWFAEDVGEVPDDPVHPNYFQWSFSEPQNNPDIESGDHGNIIAMNLDFRDVDNDGQPFLLNVPNNEDTEHQYNGIAFVNLRMNSDLAQQICGHVDHLLIWDSDVFQGSTTRPLWLRGVPETEADPHTSFHHNISIRNTVCENLRLNAQTDNQFPGDVASLWAILESAHILTELEDELRVIDDADIVLYPGCSDTGEDPGDLITGFPDGDWSPADVSGGLLDRLIEEQIVYRMDAAGNERVIDNENPLGAVGAMENSSLADGQPSENDTFTIATGTFSSGTLADIILSDNTYLVGQSTTSGAFTLDVVVDAITSVASPATINITVEASRSVAGGTANFRLKNWSTNNWDQVDSYSLGTTEIVRTKTGVTATNYVRAADGAIQFSFEVTGLVGIPTGFTASIDQIKIVVRE